jgi:hypothetical protein
MVGVMPSYGLYARHVRGLSVSNVRLQTAKPDARHALVLDDVQDAKLDDVTCMPAFGTNALMRLTQTKNVMIRGSSAQSAKAAFLKVDGKECSDIALVGNDFFRMKKVVELTDEVPDNAVRRIGNLDPADHIIN